jgi:hypothetical protein
LVADGKRRTSPRCAATAPSAACAAASRCSADPVDDDRHRQPPDQHQIGTSSR